MNRRNEQQRPAVGRQDSHLQRPIKQIIFHEDQQQLATAGNGTVYIISRHSTSQHTRVTLARTLHDFKEWTFPAQFRSTTPPFASISNKLYLGARMLADARPLVLVWTADLQFSYSLQRNRSGLHTDWEYTFLAKSSTGADVLYCGCSDGAIEVWRRDPGHARVYDRSLTGGHKGRICSLAVGQDGTLVSVDAEKANVVRIWRNLIQVATLDLGREKVLRMVCTPNKNLYVVTEAGSKLWCDLNRVVLANRPSHIFGLEYFHPLQELSRGQTRAKTCKAVGGDSETVCFLVRSSTPGHDTSSVEEWRGGKFVSSVDIRLPTFEAWTVSKHGTLYFSLRSTAH